MTASNPLFEFTLHMGDNALILGQRVSAWCGHAPILEEDIALANTGLDLIGQTKLWLSYAAEIENKDRDADDLAFRRDGRDFRNCLLVEQPNGDYAQTMMRQFLFDAWHHPMLAALTNSSNKRVAEIAEKSEKEAAYHLERSTDLLIRLGDGSQESHDRMQTALDDLWRFTGELTSAGDVETSLGKENVIPDGSAISDQYASYIQTALREATLTIPEGVGMRQGGKKGIHTEDFGYLLAEMQSLPRAYPDAAW
ncbi:MAG: phenylacetic acid degradation protein [Hyphococcus sp.]|nr:MAG: phenylacetic acid degradation protein [Marinicaulis sp.]